MARIVMFVLNDVRRDARVLREAGALAAAGHQVTVIGRPGDVAAVAAERDHRDGVEILRIPVPGRWRRALLAAGGGRGARAVQPTIGTPARRSGGVLRSAVRVVHRAGSLPIAGRLVDGLDLLVRWQLGTVAWGAAAAAAAPPADAWHAHDLTGLPAALAAQRRSGGRLVYDAHELYTEAGGTARRPGWAKAVLRRFERGAIRRADAVVTVNAGLAAELERLARPRRMLIVHNAPPAPGPTMDPAILRAASPLRAAAGVPDDAPVALYHGSFAPDRGVEILAAAIREPGLEDVHAVFLGEGPAGALVVAAAAGDPGLAGRVHVLPPVDPGAVPAWVAGADVGVMPILPTTRNHRLSTPNKLFECLAAGVPVVASDFPGIRAIVAADPTAPLGVLVDPASTAAVAHGIAAIIRAPEAERRALRERCLRAAASRWNWEVESAGLLALYAELVPAAGGGLTSMGTTGSAGAPVPVPQRVTFVLPSSGAFDSRTQRMAVGLAERGHDVLVIARAEAGLPEVERLAPGATLRRVDAGSAPAPAARSEPAPAPGPAATVRRAAGEALRIGRTALRARRQAAGARAVDRRADLYHAMGFLALPVAVDLARRAGAPFVYDARDLYAEGNNIARLPAPLRSAFARRERSWARQAAAIVTVNGSLADELERRLGVPRPTVVLNAQLRWSPPDPPPDHLRRTLGLAPDTPLVLYHGGFMRDRGLPELVAAMGGPGLERAHLVLMGSGTLEPELRRLAGGTAVAGRVHLLPPVPPSVLLEWVASADVGAMPNQPRTINERLSTPNKLFECLAAGTPVVSSDFPERRRIIVDDPLGPLGALCDPADPASIGAALRTILDLDPRARADLRARCRRAAAERYDWASQLAALVGLYGRVTGRPW